MKENLRKRALYTLKSELAAVKSLSNSVSSLMEARELISSNPGEVIVTGIGKSGFIGQKIASTLTSLGKRAIFLHPAEAAHGDIGALSDGDVMLALSFSGESKEVVKLIQYARRHFNVKVVTFTRSKKSSLGRIADTVVELKVKKEGSPGNLAPMASTTAMLVLGDMLSSLLIGDDYQRHFARSHPGGALGLEVGKTRDLMKSGRALPLVKSADRVSTVLKEITRRKLGVTGVTDKGKLTGIITDGDIRRWLLKGGDPENDIAKKIMTRSPKTISTSSSLKEALTLMEKYKITTLFVLDKGKPAGIIHIHDIVESNIV